MSGLIFERLILNNNCESRLVSTQVNFPQDGNEQESFLCLVSSRSVSNTKEITPNDSPAQPVAGSLGTSSASAWNMILSSINIILPMIMAGPEYF